MLYYLSIACVFVLIGGEIVFAINKNFIEYSDFGVAKLDTYFEGEFHGKQSAAIPEADNQHLTRIILNFAEKSDPKKEDVLYAIVYNDNIALGTLQWIFYRRFFYHSIPTFFVEDFKQALAFYPPDFFKDFTLYFVQSTDHTLLNQNKRDKTAGLEFEKMLLERDIEPDTMIYTKNGDIAFRVYKFKSD